MTILNTTFILHPSASAEAVEWIRQNFRHDGPAPMLVRVNPHQPQPDHETYAMHLTFDNADAALAWQNGPGADLLSLMANRWGERALFFQSLLDVID